MESGKCASHHFSMSDRVFAIDLGTTNSCIAYVNDRGDATAIQNDMNEETTPSVVYFGENSQGTNGIISKKHNIWHEASYWSCI